MLHPWIINRLWLLRFVALGCALGCTSATSTLLQRSERDEMLGTSNGCHKPFQAAKPFKGIPVTVRVPTHVDITIEESLFFNQQDMTPVFLSTRHLQAEAEYVYSDKIISVDPKRPVAGGLDYAMGFGTGENYFDKQFFSKIDYDVQDETLATLDSILLNVVPTLGLGSPVANTTAAKSSGSSPKSMDAVGLLEVKRTVAWKRFDISEQGFECQVSEFVSRHMNSIEPITASGAGGAAVTLSVWDGTFSTSGTRGLLCGYEQ